MIETYIHFGNGDQSRQTVRATNKCDERGAATHIRWAGTWRKIHGEANRRYIIVDGEQARVTLREVQ